MDHSLWSKEDGGVSKVLHLYKFTLITHCLTSHSQSSLTAKWSRQVSVDTVNFDFTV